MPRVAADEPLRVEVLGSNHDRSMFESGVDALDKYLRTQAGQDARKYGAAPFLLLTPDGSVAGYYTLSSTAVRLAELPLQIVGKLPRYPLIPATLLGRLAVDADQIIAGVVLRQRRIDRRHRRSFRGGQRRWKFERRCAIARAVTDSPFRGLDPRVNPMANRAALHGYDRVMFALSSDCR